MATRRLPEVAITAKLSLLIYFSACLIGFVQCQTKEPKLEILPIQSLQRKPVGKSLMLTCRPDVDNTNLVTDLQWQDNTNMVVQPKPNITYNPLYDSKGRSLPTTTGQAPPAMYTETLPGDQSLALIIPALLESMAGTYFCSASYAAQRLEVSVQIETYVAITWRNAPENQYPILGDDYKVKCEVHASPPPTVDWLRNGDPIKSGGRYVVEADGLLIRGVKEADDGIYTCRAFVIQTGELSERNIRLEVYIKPVVSPLPPELEAIEGQSFSTYCNATGKPVPEFSWIKDLTQQNVATADRFLVNPQTGLLTITKVAQEDYGTYTCAVKNDAGISEARTKLNVLVKPKIYELYNITSAVKKEAALTCRATGRPAPEITFRRWGTEEEFVPGPQPDDDRIVLEQYGDNDRGESTGTLRISNLMRTDDGLYQCIARNKGDTAFKTGHIAVEFPPNFDHMKELPPVFTWQERKANLSCLAMGIPNATIEWRWNGRPIKDQYDKNLVIEGTGPRSDLIVTPIDRRYYSAYKCIASNIHGTAEQDMVLREAHLPEYVVSAKPRVVTATTMTFDIIGPVAERGLPIIAYSVQYKEEYNPDWATAYNRSWSPDSPYIVEGLKPQTSYNFRFAARNMVGLGSWGSNIVQSTPRRSAPEEPKMLHSPIHNEEGEEKIIISPYSDHFELRWNVPADNGEPIDYYQVKFCPGHKVNGEWNELESECITREIIEGSNLEMAKLSPNTYYRIELRAHNAIGFSTPASILMRTARGSDDVVLRADKRALSSAAIVGIAIGGVLILLVIIDFLCCITVRMGVLASMCRKTKRSPSDMDEEKLGREEKEPLHTPPGSIKKNSSVEFDGRVVHSRSGDIIGKNSAV
ncbi:unnamed protein product [Hermetia illucens]|uniref:Fasciclin-2 n=1 Tax=Hermetia illucens TaxID=343691 RepID=A0A7R8YW95_HERIL|nr:fasciclin-2 isoform X3 [Hermetia illucens]CAD7087678.1 unnamed protein product [Hermetia illucens]